MAAVESKAPEQRHMARRQSDELRAWFPVILSVITTLMSAGVLWGKIDGRFNLLEYRLNQIERKVDGPR